MCVVGKEKNETEILEVVGGDGEKRLKGDGVDWGWGGEGLWGGWVEMMDVALFGWNFVEFGVILRVRHKFGLILHKWSRIL